MEKDLLSTVPLNKLYKENSIWLGSFLGGPLVAGYIIAENYKNMGQIKNVKPTWIITIVATIVIFGIIFFVPALENLPNMTMPIIYIVIANFLFQTYQGKQVKAHIENGGQIHSMWRVALIGIIGLITTLAIIFGILLITDSEFLQAV